MARATLSSPTAVLVIGLVLFLLTLQAAAADQANVFIYHRFDDSRFPSTNISSRDFQSHLEILHRQDFTVLTLGQILDKIKHGEILLRMIDKEGDIVSPSNFLPAAERYNMITLIDEWVVNKAIEWLAGRKDKVFISVNLSGMSVSNRDFLNFVVSKIKLNDINPELLCFEITETAAISHLSTAIHFMNVLKKLGCSFALDDFGSGLSSFSYLTSLPVDYLKIDGTFVMDIDKDPMHYAMVKSINEVGQVMGIRTIAEFAASESIINSLREIGVDHAQGYAIERPVPLSSIAESGPVLRAVKGDSENDAKTG